VELIGRKIGSYVVERELGAGGAGTVYLCGHTMIDRKVAVKVLHDEQARDPDTVARFFQEAKSAADIGHPNILVIIDFGTIPTPAGDRSYLMMECLDGESLDKRLRRGGLSLDDISHITSQVCSALAACHGKGIVHRDLKPANVQLCPRSFDPLFVKVLDFGIAKLTTPAPGVRKTVYGMVLGTPAYMSPEQCEGKGAIDHRSDIYSLGVMLYEMLTGTLPFGGEIRDMVMGHLQQIPPPPSSRNPAVPPAWDALCMRMMEKRKEARFQSMVEVGQALADLDAHATAYNAYRAGVAASGHSGSTMVIEGAGAVSDGAPARLDSADSRPTVHLSMAEPGSAAWAPVPGALTPSGAMPAIVNPTPSGPVPAALTPSGAWPAVEVGNAPAGWPAPPGGWPIATGEFASDAHRSAPPPASVPSMKDIVGEAAAIKAGQAACNALVHEPRNARFLALLMVRPTAKWFNVMEVCETSGTAAPAELPVQPLFCAWLEHPWADPSMVAVVFLSLRDGASTVVLTHRPTH
jgi:serine/threonine protein kinase